MKGITGFLVALCVLVTGYAQPSGGQGTEGEAGSQGQAIRAASVNEATGAIQYATPLGSISDGALTVPVGLNYGSIGHVLHDNGGVVGLGWTLETGGSLVREVRGIPDDAVDGLWYRNYEHQRDQTKAANREVDDNYDIYRFSAGGYVGAFYVTAADSVHQIPLSDVRIETHHLNGNRSEHPTGFRLTLPTGTRYDFGFVEGSSTPSEELVAGYTSSYTFEDEETKVEHIWKLKGRYPTETSGVPDGYFISAYYLTAIKTVMGAELGYTYSNGLIEEPLINQVFNQYVALLDDNEIPSISGVLWNSKTYATQGKQYVRRLTSVNSAHTPDYVAMTYTEDPRFDHAVLTKVGFNGTTGLIEHLLEYDEFKSTQSADVYYPKSIYNPFGQHGEMHPEEYSKPALAAVKSGLVDGAHSDLLPKTTFEYNGYDVRYPHPEFRAYRDVRAGGGPSQQPGEPLHRKYRNQTTYTDYLGLASKANHNNGFFNRARVGGRIVLNDNRDPVPEEAKKTLLKRVGLPTGGSVQIEYEPHRFSEYTQTSIAIAEESCTATSSSQDSNGSSCEFTTHPQRFTVHSGNIATLRMTLTILGSNLSGGMGCLIYKVGREHEPAVSISGSIGRESQMPQTVYLQSRLADRYGDDMYGEYELILEGGGIGPAGVTSTVGGSAVVAFDEHRGNKPAPGLRVKSIEYDDRINADKRRIEYSYNLVTEGHRAEESGYGKGDAGFSSVTRLAEGYHAFNFSSSSRYNLRWASGSPVMYSQVTIDQPGRIHKVTNDYEPPGGRSSATDDTPLSSRAFNLYSPRDGRLKRSRTYSNDPKYPFIDNKYVYEQSSLAIGLYNHTYSRSASGAGGTVRHLKVTPPRVDSVIRKEKSWGGFSGMQTTVIDYEYHQAFNSPMITRVETTLHDGSVDAVRTTYSYDYSNSESSIRQRLRALNLIALPVAKGTYVEGHYVSGSRISLSRFSSSGQRLEDDSVSDRIGIYKTFEVGIPASGSGTTVYPQGGKTRTLRDAISVRGWYSQGMEVI